MHIRTKELPQIGAFGHARKFLYKERLWEISVEFVENVNRLGVSYDDRCRTDVCVFGPDGQLGGWQGSYGGSSASMFSNSQEAQATAGNVKLSSVPEGAVVLEITRHWKSSWVRMYVNPIHKTKLLSENPTDIDVGRYKDILRPFKSLKAPYRQEPLNKLSVTTEELEECVSRGWLKCHKGKQIKRLEKPQWVGLSHQLYKYFDFAGAKITTAGKNLLEN